MDAAINLQISEQERHLLLEACKLHREKFTNGYAMTLLMGKLEALPIAPVRACSCPCHKWPDGELCEECCDGPQTNR